MPKIAKFGKLISKTARKCLGLEEKEMPMVRYFWHRGPWTGKNRDPFITVEKRTGNQLTSFKMDRNSKCVLRSALNNSWNGKKNPQKSPSKFFQRINLTDISSFTTNADASIKKCK